MAPAFSSIAAAIAARYAPGTMPAPSGAGVRGVKSSTAAPTEQLGQLPAVVVFPTEGDFDTGAGTRKGTQSWAVQFFLAPYSDRALASSSALLLRWLEVLADRHLAGSSLGGAVAVVRTTGWRAGRLSYAGVDYIGAELRVTTTTTEPWGVTA